MKLFSIPHAQLQVHRTSPRCHCNCAMFSRELETSRPAVLVSRANDTVLSGLACSFLIIATCVATQILFIFCIGDIATHVRSRLLLIQTRAMAENEGDVNIYRGGDVLITTPSDDFKNADANVYPGGDVLLFTTPTKAFKPQ